MVDKMTLKQVFHRISFGSARGNHQSAIAPYSFITIPELCDGPDQAAQYHILGF
jgi:hypothetical protein